MLTFTGLWTSFGSLDKEERIYSEGQYLRCRPYIFKKAVEMNVTPMFEVNLSAVLHNAFYF